MRLPTVVADFAGAIKGLKSFASMQDKIDGVLAVAKIAADADARACARTSRRSRPLPMASSSCSRTWARSCTRRPTTSRPSCRRAHRGAIRLARKASEGSRPMRAAGQARQAEVNWPAGRAGALAAEARTPAAQQAAQQAAQPASVAPAPAPPPSAFLAVPAQRHRPRATSPHAEVGTICERLGVTMTAAFVADGWASSGRVEARRRSCTENDHRAHLRGLQQHVEQVYAAQRGRWQHDLTENPPPTRPSARHSAAASSCSGAFMAGALAALTTKDVPSEQLMAELVSSPRHRHCGRKRPEA